MGECRTVVMKSGRGFLESLQGLLSALLPRVGDAEEQAAQPGKRVHGSCFGSNHERLSPVLPVVMGLRE